MSENTNNTPDLPEFLNAEPDEILAAIARKAEESEKGGAE